MMFLKLFERNEAPVSAGVFHLSRFRSRHAPLCLALAGNVFNTLHPIRQAVNRIDDLHSLPIKALSQNADYFGIVAARCLSGAVDLVQRTDCVCVDAARPCDVFATGQASRDAIDAIPPVLDDTAARIRSNGGCREVSVAVVGIPRTSIYSVASFASV